MQAKWIRGNGLTATDCPLFEKRFSLSGVIAKAELCVTARGVYEATLNGERVGDLYMTPGWTHYEHRIQVQTYDVTDLVQAENTLRIQLTDGWYMGRIGKRIGKRCADPKMEESGNIPPEALYESAVIAELTVTMTDGTTVSIATDADWMVGESPLRHCDIYDGAIYDATHEPVMTGQAVVATNQNMAVLCEQICEPVKMQERLYPVAVIHTPKGETVLDFGQNLVGAVELSLTASAGDTVALSFAEILDKDGNFYNANYRGAKAQYQYTCRAGEQTYRPTMTFYGFRYVRVDAFPGQIDSACFTACVLHTDLKRTGWIETSDPMLSQLFSNIIWGQKSNYLDVPTDCPQRDERFGWTCDAQVFIKAASYNFDVQAFFHKWLLDMKSGQFKDGGIPAVIPAIETDFFMFIAVAAAWGDAVTICPWQIYQTYADREILEIMYPTMTAWIDHITKRTTTPYLWTGTWQFGDWLELNAPYGKEKGKTRDDLVATAYYAYSTELVCKIGRILGQDVSKYEALYEGIRHAFQTTFADDFKTQTEHVLALQFRLTDQPERIAKGLAELIVAEGTKLQTGFLGTPYLLHVLSRYGYSELAYTLLLRKEFPSWLYPITKGATTMWEHWDGIMPNGDVWPVHMNSYNHYAYGAVADWMYEVAAGINPVEEKPGFAEIVFRPTPTDQIARFGARIKTRFGLAASRWWHEGDQIRYEIITPVPATAVIDGREYRLQPGTYRF